MAVGTVNNVTRPGSKIPTITHPHYKRSSSDWLKYRLTFEGGQPFIHKYLVKFSNREDHIEFFQRRKLAYCPAFAKSAIYEIRNSIFTRTSDIVRAGGSKAYQDASVGLSQGVDMNGSSMSLFMTVKVLPELLVMSRVGVYIDMPTIDGPTLLDSLNKRPYIYMYQAEDIRSYTYDKNGAPGQFSSVLLVDHDYKYDELTGLPCDEIERYRYIYLKIDDQGNRSVWCQIYTAEGYCCDEYGSEIEDWQASDEIYEFQIGKLTEIPFHLIEIEESLLADVANYQVALLNMASGDVWYATRANFPFYIEPYDPKSESPYIKKQDQESFDSTDPSTTVTTTTTSTEITVGPTRGRRYPAGTNQPAFISPPTEPIVASMAKQDQLKTEIRQLVHLALSSLSSSADSKSADRKGLTNGLSHLSSLLEYAENRIAYFWALYEGRNETAEIKYPTEYELASREEVDKEITNLLDLADSSSSMTLKKRAMKTIATLRIGRYVKTEELKKIHDEIDNGKVVIATAKNITLDVQAGIVSLDTASLARGYPAGEAEKAAQDHAEKVARIQAAQTPPDPAARGLPDLSANPDAGKQEKAAQRDPTLNPSNEDPTRGPGK